MVDAMPLRRSMERVSDALAGEQRAGLLAALKGRLAVLLVLALWIGFTRFPPTVYYMLALITAFALTGIAQMAAVERFGPRHWSIYLSAAFDAAILTVAIVVFSGPVTADLSIPMGYRFNQYVFFFLLLVVAAFGYAPSLVLWTGAVIAVLWAAGSVWVHATHDTVGWSDIAPDATPEEFLAVFLSPNFFGVGSRFQEILLILSIAGLLALVVWRARRVVYRYAEAEGERRQIADLFGAYVPEAVARELIASDGGLEPRQSEATVMFTDIAGFTATSEHMPPAEVMRMVEEYFAAAGEVIGRHGGVIAQFQGDGILATFNVPMADPDHAAAAVRAALELQETLSRQRFAGVELTTRIGVNTGPIVSGTTGSRGRRAYTVYGDAVNAAARIEALNKEHGTRVLVAESTVAAAGDGLRFSAVGSAALRGRAEPVQLFAPVLALEQASGPAPAPAPEPAPAAPH